MLQTGVVAPLFEKMRVQTRSNGIDADTGLGAVGRAVRERGEGFIFVKRRKIAQVYTVSKGFVERRNNIQGGGLGACEIGEE